MTEKNRGLATQVAERVKELRSRRGLSQQELAQQIEMKAQYLSQLERGKLNLTLDTLERVAAGLGVRIAALFSSDDGGGPLSTESIVEMVEKMSDDTRQKAVRILRVLAN